MSALAARSADFARRHKAILIVLAAALAVRLGYNLLLHPPLDHVRSDMAGYVRRASEVLDRPWGERSPYATFFPFGTHLLVAAIQAVFGRGEGAALGVAYALMGAGAAAYAFAFGARLLPDRPRLLAAYGALLVLHVPAIMLGGFVLSEIPFTLALAAGAFHALRHFDEGRARDALLAGAALALGVAIRPQAIVSVALLGALFALRRRRADGSPRTGLRSIVCFLAPLALVVAFGVKRAEHHTGKPAFMSTNGGFNLVFGRCHPMSLRARDTPNSEFQAPSLKRLGTHEEKHGYAPIVALDPALGPSLVIEGPIWDEAAARRLAARCVEETGPLRQLKYSGTHVMLLYLYNLPWPSTGVVANVWAGLQLAWVPGAAIALARSFRRSHQRHALAAVHVWALLFIAIFVFGEARLRVPYDAFLMLLALDVYAPVAARLARRLWRVAPSPAP